MNYLTEADKAALRGTAILRLDFNAEDNSRIQASLPSIKFLLDAADKVVILSHKGRPNGTDLKFSLRNTLPELQKLLGRQIDFFSEFRFEEIHREIQAASSGSVFMLENLRFLPGEEANDESLAKDLASLGNFYVNDAFPVSHRANASIAAITQFLPSYAGLELENEIKNLWKVMKNPARPFVLVLGGAKAEDKLPIVKFLKDKLDSVLLGGVPGNTLLKLKGVDAKPAAENPEIFKEFLKYENIILPEDWKTNQEGAIWDIGEKTVQNFINKIRGAKTIVWNGPLGFTEKGFKEGSEKIAKAIADNKTAHTLVGGGETVAFLKQQDLDEKISFVSTGGGAMLEFLAGKELPGIKALE